jgi:hypothetical protein
MDYINVTALVALPLAFAVIFAYILSKFTIEFGEIILESLEDEACDHAVVVGDTVVSVTFTACENTAVLMLAQHSDDGSTDSAAAMISVKIGRVQSWAVVMYDRWGSPSDIRTAIIDMIVDGAGQISCDAQLKMHSLPIYILPAFIRTGPRMGVMKTSQ